MIMSTGTPATNRSPLEWLRLRGYFFQYAGVLTLIMGIYIHLTRLFIGIDLVIQKVITPEFDMLLALPMIYTTLFGWLAWKRVSHPSKSHVVLFAVILVYFTISLPLHIRTYFVHNAELLRFFPVWYSVLIILVQFAMLLFLWRLQLKKGE